MAIVDPGAPRALLWGIPLLALPGLVLALVLQAGREDFEMLWVIAPFFLGFGLFKGALGLDAWRSARAGDDARDKRLIASHGGPAELRRWAIYKLCAALVAIAAAVFCLVLALQSTGG